MIAVNHNIAVFSFDVAAGRSCYVIIEITFLITHTHTHTRIARDGQRDGEAPENYPCIINLSGERVNLMTRSQDSRPARHGPISAWKIVPHPANVSVLFGEQTVNLIECAVALGRSSNDVYYLLLESIRLGLVLVSLTWSFRFIAR